MYKIEYKKRSLRDCLVGVNASCRVRYIQSRPTTVLERPIQGLRLTLHRPHTERVSPQVAKRFAKVQ